MVDTSTVRNLARRLEPCHSFIYFSPDAGLGFAGLGLDGGQAYFASRSAAMGPVGPEVVAATFFNFKPELAAEAIPSAWGIASPETILATRFAAAEASLRTYLGDLVDHPDLIEITDQVLRCAEAARPEGRPLFAAHAALPVPDEPLQRFWHAITLEREHRGDAHVAALLLCGLDAPEVLVLDVANGSARLPKALLQATRGWTDHEWDVATSHLDELGLINGDGAVTEAGRALREQVELRTDEGSMPFWSLLDDEEILRLHEIAQPFSAAINKGAFGR
jgi:hypothetical protein